MSIFDNIRAAAFDILNDLGADMTLRRTLRQYDEATRRAEAIVDEEQVLRSIIFPVEPGDRSTKGTTTIVLDRVAYCSPIATGGEAFDPAPGDVLDDGSTEWRVIEATIHAQQGVAMLYKLGLKAA